MLAWESALNKFLDKYKNEEYFIGAIVTGSYVTGNNDKNSDIDVYIILADNINWRERGNKLVDGYIIEYFINSIKKTLSYFEQELESYHMSTTMMFVNSKIIFDKDNQIKKLVDIAKNNIKSDLKNINDFKKNLNCYSVWDGFDELESKYLKKEDIDFSYNIFLNRIIDSYFYNKQIPSLPLNKIEKIFMNREYRENYNVQKLPDLEFNNLLISCFTEKVYDKKFNCAKNIYNYFLKQFPEFDINDYKLRSSAE